MPPCPLHPPDPAATLGPAPHPFPIPWAAAHMSPAVGAQGTGALPHTAASSSLCWGGSRQTLLSNKLIKQLSPHLKLAKHYKAHFLPEAFLSRVPAAWPFPGTAVSSSAGACVQDGSAGAAKLSPSPCSKFNFHEQQPAWDALTQSMLSTPRASLQCWHWGSQIPPITQQQLGDRGQSPRAAPSKAAKSLRAHDAQPCKGQETTQRDLMW